MLLDVLTVVIPYGVLLMAIVWDIRRRYGRDKQALTDYITSQGGTLNVIKRSPFGPGWESGNDTIYTIEYQDVQQKTYRAYAKVSRAGAVYLRPC
jgi:hypothetical protein